MESNLEALAQLWRTPQRSLILTHYNPDGDALGSSLALARLLSKLGHQVQLLLPNPAPPFLPWMPGLAEALTYEQHVEAAQQALRQAQTIFCLDFSQLHRLGPLSEPLRQATTPKVIIDHHRQGEDFAQLTLCRPEVPATSLMLYHYFTQLGFAQLLDAQMATCLYTGILTDTGLFQHANTTPQAHEAAAALMTLGAAPSTIYRNLYARKSPQWLRFMGHSFLHRLQWRPDFASAYLVLPRQDLSTFAVGAGATQGLMGQLLELQGLRCAVLLKGHPDHVRLSFRSVGELDVSAFAQQHFHGGGHRNAAGGRYAGSLQVAVEALDRLLPAFVAASAGYRG